MEVQFVGIIRDGPFEGRKITSDGRVLQKTRFGRYIRFNNTASGYLSVRTFINKKSYDEFVHILVARTFVDNPNNYLYVIHLDGDIQNNYYKNLIWSEYPDLDGEQFTAIPGFPSYKISKEGVVKSHFNPMVPRILKTDVRDGYSSVKLKDTDGNTKGMLVHRLVALTYIPNPENLPEIDHIDRDKSNNKVENLRWVSRKIQASNRTTGKLNKPILQYRTNGEFIKEYKNSKHAVKELGLKVRPATINSCANRNKRDLKYSSAGFRWRYKSYEDTLCYILQEGEVAVPIKGKFGNVELNYPKFKITNFGNVISKRGYVMAKSLRAYPTVNLNTKRVPKAFKIHVLVALFFVEGRSKKKCVVDHLDGNKGNFHFTNLEWVTRSENAQRSAHKKHKKVKQINPKTRKVFKVWESIKAAAISICGDKNGTSGISRACKKINQTAFGFIWEYA